MATEDPFTCAFQEPVPIRELLSEDGLQFSIRGGYDEIEEEEKDTNVINVYPAEKLEPYLLDEHELSDDDDDEQKGDISASFQYLRKRGVDLWSDGKVKKVILTPGEGDALGDHDLKNIRWDLYVHYAFWSEYAEYPHDATRLRSSKPVKMSFGEQVYGFQIGVQTMKKGEKSRFLLDPEFAFGKLGAPSRIPPNTVTLLEIELVDFCPHDRALDAQEQQPTGPQTHADVIARAREFRERGNKRKQREKNVNGAISQYKKGICLLELPAEGLTEQEREATENELIRLYSNLAVSYLIKEDYKRVHSTYEKAVKSCKEKVNKSAKLNYISAKALRLDVGSDENFTEARRRIRRANELKPGDKDISMEFDKLDETIRKYKEDLTNCARRMFGFAKAAENEIESENIDEIMSEVDDEFKSTFENFLDDFLDDSDQTINRLGVSVTSAESKYCQYVCRSKNVAVKLVGPKENQQLVFTKKST